MPRRGGRDRSSVLEIVVGTVLVVLVALGGVVLSHRHYATFIDRWFFDLVPDRGDGALTWVTRLRYPAVIVAGSVVLAVVTVRRDRIRALSCLVGPPLALLTGELVVKPAVGRTLAGALSYPSGSTVGAAALAMAAVLATAPRWRPLTAVIAVAYAAWMAVAVVALRWHFPTDAVAGVAYGIGLVVLVDGLVWWAVRAVGLAERRPFRRRGPATDTPPASA